MMKSPFILLLTWLMYARITVQAPAGGLARGQQTAIPQSNDYGQLSTAESLYHLLINRVARGASRKETAQFHTDFANHPLINSIDLHHENQEETLKKLMALRVPVLDRASKTLNQKLTMEMGYLIQKTLGQSSDLLDEYHHEIYLQKKEKNKEVTRKRYHDSSDFRNRHKNVEKQSRERRRAQREQDCKEDLPMTAHMGEANSKSNSAKQVVEQAKQFKSQYSSGTSFHIALRKYLNGANYDQKDISMALHQYGRENQLRQVRAYNVGRKKRNAVGRKKRAAGSSGHITPSLESISGKRGPLSVQNAKKIKKARVDEMLSNTDWWKAHHL